LQDHTLADEGHPLMLVSDVMQKGDAFAFVQAVFGGGCGHLSLAIGILHLLSILNPSLFFSEKASLHWPPAGALGHLSSPWVVYMH
jgi:hypothetical protein